MSEQVHAPEVAVVGRLCDHRCLKDDGHVDRGELHFHGYTIPSDRDTIERLTAEKERMRSALGDLIDGLHDELRYEVGQSTHLLNLIEGAIHDHLGESYAGYVGAWL